MCFSSNSSVIFPSRSEVVAIDTPSFAKSNSWVFPYIASSINANKGLSNLFRFAVLISFIAEKPRSQHALSSGNVKANWNTGVISSYPPVRRANLSLDSILWYLSLFESDVISAKYCKVAVATSSFGKNAKYTVKKFVEILIRMCTES